MWYDSQLSSNVCLNSFRETLLAHLHETVSFTCAWVLNSWSSLWIWVWRTDGARRGSARANVLLKSSYHPRLWCLSSYVIEADITHLVWKPAEYFNWRRILCFRYIRRLFKAEGVSPGETCAYYSWWLLFAGGKWPRETCQDTEKWSQD